MQRFALRTLEFDKIKQRLAAKAATLRGKEQAADLQVRTEMVEVRNLLTETDEALRLLAGGQRFPFGGAVDIAEPVKRAQIGGTLDGETLRNILDTIAAFRQMKEFLCGEAEMAPTLGNYAAEMLIYPKLEKQLSGAISEQGEVLDSASTKLAGLRTGIVIAKNRVREKLDSILHSPDYQKYFQEQLVTMRGDRYVIPIKQEYRFNFPGVVHDQSGSGATLFIEPMAVVNLNNDIKKYIAQEKEETERILKQLSAFVGAEGGNIGVSLRIFTDLDVICAKAFLAIEMKATRPMLLTDGYIELKGSRHPLLAEDSVVPIDISVGQDFSTLLITGPNTGGKTVALKTVGLFVLMAQAGLFVPGTMVKLPVFRAVYADIGDEQSIEQSLSTFSGHLTNIVEILTEVQSKDLVLLDEICAGTDPDEGAALAMAILDYLDAQGVLTIITTHYSELKTFAYERLNMENASVEFDPSTLSPTYRLLMGVPGSSNAFYISKRLGLPEAVLARAGTFLDREHLHMENVLQNLEGERRQYEEQNREIAAIRLQNEKIRSELERKRTDFEQKRTELLRKAQEDAYEVQRKARREADAVLKELKSLKKDFDVEKLVIMADNAKKKLSEGMTRADVPLPSGQPLTALNAAKGRKVYLRKLAREGIIVEITTDTVTVAIGALKTTVPFKDCLLLAGGAPQENASPSLKRKKTASHEMFMAKQGESSLEIDVRGKTVEEAIPLIDKKIDNALLAGVSKLRIIHGKGTGMLRIGLNGYFSGHRNVKTQSVASAEDGGNGVTILELLD